jgi:Glutamate-1-semialdehyde aminotransferase
MMKKPEQFCHGNFPIYLSEGEGALVIDLDSNAYIDYICGLGANSLGHNHPALLEAIYKTLPAGLLHSLPTAIEVEATQALLELVPHANMARFFKTGADANSAAVRLARYITGKDKIFTVGYNGWHDQYMYDTPGVPKALTEFSERLPLFTPDNEALVFEKISADANKAAAIILSVPYNRELSCDFFTSLRDLCDKKNVLLILDEVVTGFRLAKGGAQEYFNVRADLVTYSKSLAAGMPLSAIAGDKALLHRIDELQVSTTFGGERLSLAAALASLKVFKNTDIIVQQKILGAKLKQGVNEIAKSVGSPLRIRGYDPIPMLNFASMPEQHLPLAKSFVGEMAKRGILMRRDVNFINAAHTEQHIEFTLQQIAASLHAMNATDTQGQ